MNTFHQASFALADCPFCGGEAQLISLASNRHYVRCMCCEQQFEQALAGDAVALWNARVTEQVQS